MTGWGLWGRGWGYNILNAIGEGFVEADGGAEPEGAVAGGDRGTVPDCLQREPGRVQGVLRAEQPAEPERTPSPTQLLTNQQRLIALFLLIENFKSEGIKKHPFGATILNTSQKTTEPY